MTLEKNEEDPTLFILKIDYLNSSYDEEITISVSNAKWMDTTNLQTFPAAHTEFKVASQNEKIELVLNFLGNQTLETLSKGTTFTASYGIFFAALLSPISNIAITLNIIKIIPFFPTTLPLSIKANLKMFFTLIERDLLSRLYRDDSLFSAEYQRAKELRPADLDYSLVSIYPRILGLKIVARIVINMAFLLFLVRLRRKKRAMLEKNKNRIS